jgi:AraC-like DNA-binding protein
MRTNCTVMMETDRSAGDPAALPASRRIDMNIAAARQVVPIPLRDAEIEVTYLDLAGSESLELPASAAHVGLAILVDGDARFEVDGESMHVSAGQAILNSCHGAVRGVTPEGGRVILAALPRNAIQVRASASHGGARRLARTAFIIGADDSLAVRAGANAAIAAVVAGLAAEHGIDEACPPSRSISLARRRLDADPARAWDLEGLASGVGVTPVTLQRGFRDCIGATVAGYAQAIRLGEARERLTSGRETRPLSAIAHAGGFASVTAFVRAYQRVFGETPTRTRAESVRYFSGDHMQSG